MKVAFSFMPKHAREAASGRFYVFLGCFEFYNTIPSTPSRNYLK